MIYPIVYVISIFVFILGCSGQQTSVSKRSSGPVDFGEERISIDDQLNEFDNSDDATVKHDKEKDKVIKELEEKLGPIEKTSFSELLKESELESTSKKELFSRLTAQEYRYVIHDIFDGDQEVVASAEAIIEKFSENNYEGSYKNRTDLSSTTGIETQHLEFSALLATEFVKTNQFKKACPQQGNCLNYYINELLPRIWRTLLDDDINNSLTEFYNGYAQTERDEFFLRRVFASPFFHNKRQSPDDDIKSNSFSIGSGISFMISGSIPDDELLKDMKSGDIIHPNAIRKHAKRLITKYPDRVAKLFVSQWLGYAPLLEVSKDDLYKNLKLEVILNEPNLIFENLIKDNEGISSFLDLKYNVVNEELAKLYGKSKPGDQWEKATINKSLFGTAFMSYKFTDHESDNPNPISRGAYIVGNLLCDSVQSPTQDQLEEVDKVLAEVDPDLSPPERMAFFRSKPSCKGCHEPIDHHGLALEEIGVFGEFRTEYYTGDKIEVGGELEGFEFTSSQDFIEKLSQHQEFKACFIGHAYNYLSGSSNIRTKRDIVKQKDISALNSLSLSETLEELVVFAFGGDFL